MATSSSVRVRQISFLLFTTVWLVGTRGCDPDLASQCRGDFAELTAEVAEFRQDENRSRNLAGVAVGAPEAAPLNEDEKEACTHWARKRLERVQELLDVTMREPGLRAASIDLNQIATDFVMLHGACEKGDRKGMRRELASLETSIPQAQKKACWPTGTTAVNP